jgi:hypothetical protein
MTEIRLRGRLSKTLILSFIGQLIPDMVPTANRPLIPSLNF